MVKILNPNKNYKVKVKYANKTTKTMVLTGKQIMDRRRMNKESAKRSAKPYVPYTQITVVE